MKRNSFHYVVWSTANHPGMFDDLGKPLRTGWYFDLYTLDSPVPSTFGPFLTSDRAEAEVKAKIEKAKLSSCEPH